MSFSNTSGKLVFLWCLVIMVKGMVFCAPGPNFIIILADDLGYGDISAFGSATLHNPPINTPEIDALMTGGMRFNDFHSNGPVCGPTRAALVTGLYQNRIPDQEEVMFVDERDAGMDTSTITFAEVLREQGYATGLMGKWHLGLPVEFNPTNQGFDQFRGFISGNIDYISHIDGFGYYDWWHDKEIVREEGYTTDLITNHSLDFLDEHKNEPFCLYIAHAAPHFPYQGRNDAAFRMENPGVSNGGKGPRFDTDPNGAYKEMIEAMDEGIGLVMDKVTELGLDSSTLVIFTSDNGPVGAGLAGVLRDIKASTYEGGHRVPTAFYWPGKIAPGAVSEETALTMDIFPTLMALAGVQVTGVDGVDLSSLLLEGTPLEARNLFWDFRNNGAVRQGDFKLNLRENGDLTLHNFANTLDESDDVNNNSLKNELEQLFTDWQQEMQNPGQVEYVSVVGRPASPVVNTRMGLIHNRVYGNYSGQRFEMNGRKMVLPGAD